MRAILLMPTEIGELAKSIAISAGINISSVTVANLKALKKAAKNPFDLLLSFGTSIIVPKSILQITGTTAINIHAGSPEFPGRDPHHFAIYNAVKKYGATMHFMNDKVDDGQIIDVELFDIPDLISPADLLEQANLAGIKLLRRFFYTWANSEVIVPTCEHKWGLFKSTRRDFTEMCRVECDMPKAEVLRRWRATEMAKYNNLYIDIHGLRFRLEGKIE